MSRGLRPTDEATGRFGENLMICRRRARLSQEELAFQAQMHRNQVSQMECGQYFPGVEAAVRLAGCLNVLVDDLVAGLKWTPGYTIVVPGKWGVADSVVPMSLSKPRATVR
jgi:transcriptional regulator with XRE-family HTH domain